MSWSDVSQADVNRLLDIVYSEFGYDFRNYSRSSLNRRIQSFMTAAKVPSISDIPGLLKQNDEVLRRLVSTISVPVTDMFRDPFVFREIRKKIIPYLATFPRLKIWHAGCATGEEAYSLRIIFQETNLSDRVTTYATDLCPNVLRRARTGRFPKKNLERYCDNYMDSGGSADFQDYCEVTGDSIQMKQTLQKQILFTPHNLVSDTSFGKVEFILCRNVLIYFDRVLQRRVLELFAKSLIPNGFLCLGTRETIALPNVEKWFTCIDRNARLYVRT